MKLKKIEKELPHKRNSLSCLDKKEAWLYNEAIDRTLEVDLKLCEKKVDKLLEKHIFVGKVENKDWIKTVMNVALRKEVAKAICKAFDEGLLI